MVQDDSTIITTVSNLLLLLDIITTLACHPELISWVVSGSDLTTLKKSNKAFRLVAYCTKQATKINRKFVSDRLLFIGQMQSIMRKFIPVNEARKQPEKSINEASNDLSNGKRNKKTSDNKTSHNPASK